MNRFPLIDVLRGFSALLVLFYHVLAYRHWEGFQNSGLGRLPSLGWVGVDLFFVISGFVIARTAMLGHLSAQPTWRFQYFERRARRIIPLYIATLAIYISLIYPNILGHGLASLVHLFSHLTFTHNLWHETHGSINSPNWSVGLEVQFYILIAVIAPWLARTHTLKVFFILCVIALCWRYGSTIAMPPGSSTPIIQFIYSSQLPGVLDEFACGILVAKLVQNGHLHFSAKKFAMTFACAALLLTLAWVTIGDGTQYWNSTATIVFWRTLVCAGFGTLLCCVVMIRSDGGRLLQPFRYLGEISYGIYLWHMPVLLVLVEKTQLSGFKLLSTTASLTVMLASLSWYGFEKHWMKIARPT